jgi:hypothetical protein
VFDNRGHFEQMMALALDAQRSLAACAPASARALGQRQRAAVPASPFASASAAAVPHPAAPARRGARIVRFGSSGVPSLSPVGEAVADGPAGASDGPAGVDDGSTGASDVPHGAAEGPAEAASAASTFGLDRARSFSDLRRSVNAMSRVSSVGESLWLAGGTDIGDGGADGGRAGYDDDALFASAALSPAAEASEALTLASGSPHLSHVEAAASSAMKARRRSLPSSRLLQPAGRGTLPSTGSAPAASRSPSSAAAAVF